MRNQPSTTTSDELPMLLRNELWEHRRVLKQTEAELMYLVSLAILITLTLIVALCSVLYYYKNYRKYYGCL